MTGAADREIWERLSVTEGLHFQMLWWQKRRFQITVPGGDGVDAVI